MKALAQSLSSGSVLVQECSGTLASATRQYSIATVSSRVQGQFGQCTNLRNFKPHESLLPAIHIRHFTSDLGGDDGMADSASTLGQGAFDAAGSSSPFDISTVMQAASMGESDAWEVAAEAAWPWTSGCQQLLGLIQSSTGMPWCAF